MLGDRYGGRILTTSPTTRREPAARAALLDRWQRRPPGQSRAVFYRLHRIKPWTLAFLLRPRQARSRTGFVELVPATTSPICKAVLIALTRWHMLTAYAETGDWPIDNPAENVQRAIAVRRRNHFFLGSEDGGHNAAVFCSLIPSCGLQGIDPVGYLMEICERMLNGDTDHAALTSRAIAASRDLAPTIAVIQRAGAA